MQKLDWITWSVEAAGAIIFVVWTILPIREFHDIFRRIFSERRR